MYYLLWVNTYLLDGCMETSVQVLIQVTFSNKSLSTFKWTNIWAFSSMDTHMSFEVTRLGKSFTTCLALIRPLSCMSSDMNFECRRAHEPLFTDLALKWTLTCVFASMVCQMP
jgi:hypothetical protein